MIKSGRAVLSLDSYAHGQRAYRSEYEPPVVWFHQKNQVYRFRDLMMQTVIDYRRAMDYLETRKEIDREKIGLIGISLGAFQGGVLAGVDERVKVPVLIVGGAGLMDEVNPATFAPYISPRPPTITTAVTHTAINFTFPFKT